MGVIGLGLRLGGGAFSRLATTAAVGGAQPTLALRWVGVRSYQRFLRTEEKEFRKRLRKQLRTAANLIKKRARSNARSAYPGGTGRLSKGISVSVKVTRRTVSARVGWRLKGRYFPAILYAPALERGGTVTRRRSAKRKRHTAEYQGRAFFEPAVRSTEREVYRLLGRSFKVSS